MSSAMTENDKLVVQLMKDTFEKGFDGYHPHSQRDWVAIRRLIKSGLVEESFEGSCDTCGKENARCFVFTTAQQRGPVVRWKRLFERAQIPAYATEGAAGFDLRAIDNHELRPGAITRVRLGLAAEIPPGYEIQIRPRSGLASRGVLAISGTIDSDYRGEISVLMTAHSIGWIYEGDRIAQGVLARAERAIHVEVEELSDTRRGTGGFGSTGR